MDEPPYRLSRILTETYATPPSRRGACNRRATRTLDGHVNVLTVSVSNRSAARALRASTSVSLPPPTAISGNWFTNVNFAKTCTSDNSQD